MEPKRSWKEPAETDDQIALKDMLIGAQMDILFTQMKLLKKHQDSLLSGPENISVIVQVVSSVLEVISSLRVKTLRTDPEEGSAPVPVETVFHTLEQALLICQHLIRAFAEDLSPIEPEDFEEAELEVVMEMLGSKVDDLLEKIKTLRESEKEKGLDGSRKGGV